MEGEDVEGWNIAEGHGIMAQVNALTAQRLVNTQTMPPAKWYRPEMESRRVLRPRPLDNPRPKLTQAGHVDLKAAQLKWGRNV